MFQLIFLSVAIAQEPVISTEVSDSYYIQYELPDPAVAAVLSSQVGFGAGHFYSKRPIAGVTHFLFQGVGIGLAGSGLYKFATGFGNTIDTLNVDQGGIDTTDNYTNPLEVTTPTVTISPDGETMAQGIMITTAGLSIYLVDRLVDTLTAPVSAKKRALKLLGNESRLDKKLRKRQNRK